MVYINFFKEMLQRHKVRNVDFIVNIHDDGEHIRFYDQLKNRFVPIFVLAKDKTNKNFPVKIPFIDYGIHDWEIVNSSLKDANEWINKKDIVYWRGSTTGRNYNLKNYLDYPRIKLVNLSKHYSSLIDAQLTGIVQVDDQLRNVIFNKFGIVPGVSHKDQLKYKYLITVDGNTCTYPGYLWRLITNSVVFKQETDNVQWFYPLLKPWVHYVPVKADLSDLLEKIEYAKFHDQEMKKISLNAQKYVKDNLGMEGMYLYAAMALNQYAEHQDFELVKPSFWLTSINHQQLAKFISYVYGIWKAISSI